MSQTEKYIATIVLRVIELVKEDPEMKEALLGLVGAIADRQTAEAEYKRALAVRTK